MLSTLTISTVEMVLEDVFMLMSVLSSRIAVSAW